MKYIILGLMLMCLVSASNKTVTDQKLIKLTENNFVVLRLSSKEIRLFKKECFATIGRVSNSDIYNVVLGKAGRSRWMGIRPTVRGSVMNPVDHPHGGGEGRCPIGKPRPLTPWGKPALGVKTRKRKKKSDIFCIMMYSEFR